MLALLREMIIEICEFLSNCEKIRLSAVSKSMDKIKHKLIYREKIDVHRIQNLSFFDNFRSIKMSCVCDLYQKYIVYVNPNRTYDEPTKDKLPLLVTHLEFDIFFNREIKNTIPSSVTHLIFGNMFNQSINDIPSSITHLTLGVNFDKYDTFPPVTNIIYLKISKFVY